VTGRVSRRRWFQFHLSTLIITMIATAGVITLNLYPFDAKQIVRDMYVLPGTDGHTFGWPVHVVIHVEEPDGRSFRSIRQCYDWSGELVWGGAGDNWHIATVPLIAINLLAGFLILLVVCFLVECYLRHRS
jgi:hypothetical protein